MTPPIPVPIFDGHNDVLLRLHRHGGTDAPRLFLEGAPKGHLDLPKATEGRFAGGLFAVFVPSPRQPDAPVSDATGPNTTGPNAETTRRTPAPVDLASAQSVALGMISLLLRIEAESNGRVRICDRVSDIAQCMKDGVLAVVLHMEGAEAIDSNFEMLDVLRAAGLRSLGPVWSRPNAFGEGVPFLCPSSPDTGPGLTDLGKELVRRCNRLRILIDLSHINERGFWDAAAITDSPLVATHSNAHALSPHSRNLTDRQLAAIRDTNGLVGVNLATAFLRPDGAPNGDASLELVLEHFEYMIAHVGEDGVALGSDFDGARMPSQIATAAGLQTLVEAMRARGFSESLIEKLCFRNWLRVLDATWSSRA
jgi:membrane dipeptidase